MAKKEKKEEIVETTKEKEEKVETTKEKKEKVAEIDAAITKLEKEKNNNLKNLVIKIIIAAIIIFLVIIGGKCLFNKLNKNDEISGVKKILSPKYTDVSCLDTSCNGIMAIEGNKLSDYRVLLFNSKGKRIANYKTAYDNKNKMVETPIEVTDKYFIATSSLEGTTKVNKYIIKDSKGKNLFTTSNKLKVVNENFISMKEEKSYSLITSTGKSVYKNIKDIFTYVDGDYIRIETSDSAVILNRKGDVVLDGYKVAKVLYEDDYKTAYGFIVKNIKEDVYNYYLFSKKEIVGDSFSSYSQIASTQDYRITKKENNKTVSYILHKNGKQEQTESVTEYVEDIKSKLDSDKYTIYENSIYDAKQKEIAVDNKETKEFGILNVDSNKFTKIYKYNKDKKYFYSSVSKISNEDQKYSYLKITCSKYYCDKATTIIYNLNDKKIAYSVDDLTIGSYKEYKDGYKVVRFYSLTGNKYSNKYVAFDKNNKELTISDNNIVIIDKDLLVGSESTYYLALYSVKENKIINKERATVIDADGVIAYRETDKNENIIVYNSKGKQLIKIMSSSYIGFSNNNYIYTEDKDLKILNIKKGKVYKYRLKDNEKLNNIAGEIIKPFNGAIFINNTNDKYAKVLNFKGNTMKKIGKAEISSVGYNSKEGNAYIIVRRTSGKGSQYGLYIAK